MKNMQDYLKLSKEDKKVEVFKGAVEMFSIMYPKLKISFNGDEFEVKGGDEKLRKLCIKDIDKLFKLFEI